MEYLYANKEKLIKKGIENHYEIINFKNQNMINNIDFLITFGGDGTVLHSSKLFCYGYIPKIISFSMVSINTPIILKFQIGFTKLPLSISFFRV